jgi:uncharacterized zinc-type alcohol dehydrogenase-like protein
MKVSTYAVPAAGQPLEPLIIERRELRPRDVLVKIHFSGICHSDIHQGRNEWFTNTFPMVPGHEIAGTVEAIGSEVTQYAVGDHVGVGVFVDSCKTCDECIAGRGQYCAEGMVGTYGDVERDGDKRHSNVVTQGGYSTHIVVDERYVLRIPKNLPPDAAAPLLCAGITVYSPLKHWNVGPGTRVGVMGLGGLGHMAVQIAAAMGAEVTLISHSPGKEEDGRALGATKFLLSSDKAAMATAHKSLDFIVNAVSADIDVDRYMHLLDNDGVMCLVGLPIEAIAIKPFTLTAARRSLAGSQIGGIPETQEMLDFCGEHNVVSKIELVNADQINEAWDRVVDSDVRYRFVIDTSTLPDVS